MQNLGDLIDGGTHHFSFTTVDDTGLPFALASGALSVYKDANTTETTTGVSVALSFDGRTGLNRVTLVLTDAFYVPDTDYSVVITTGTVDGVSVVGYVVAEFSISNRMPNVNIAQWLDVAPLALVAQRVNVSVGAMASAVLTATAIATDAITAVKIAANAITAAKIAGSAITSAKFATGAINAAAIASNAITAVKIAAAALNGKGDWNIGKTGYSLTQAFPTNFAALSITAGGLVDMTQAAADKVWSTTTRTLTAFSTALALSVWNVLESAIVTASSIGLKVKTNLDAVLSARTLAAADYFDPAADAVASVTLVDTTTANTDMRGTDGVDTATMRGTDGVDTATMRGTDGAATPANVNSEVSDVLKVDTITLPGAVAPPASPTFEQLLAHLFKAYRNKKEQDATEWRLFDDAGSAVQQKAVVSDAAGTATKEEIAAGP